MAEVKAPLTMLRFTTAAEELTFGTKRVIVIAESDWNDIMQELAILRYDRDRRMP